MLVIDLIIGMLILSGISMACLGLYGRRFADRIPAAVPYMLLMFSAAAWAVLYALDLMSDSLQLRIFFHNLRFLVLPFIPFLELWLVIAFVKKTEWLRKDWAAVVLAIPVAAALLAITSPFHTLFRYDFSITTSGPIPVLQYSEAPFYTLYFIYSFILLVIAIILLIVESRKRGTLWEEQTILLLLALALPTLINYLFFFGITLVPGVNMTAPLLWVAAILYTVSLFRYRFLDIIPIARSRLIEIMSTPMLVLDAGGRIIDLNPAACSLFSTTPSVAIGKPVNGIAPDWPDFLSLCRSEVTSRADLTRGQGGDVHFYTGSVELIRTPSGEPEGRLVLLQDVTGRKQAEDSLREEQQFSKLMLDSLPGIFYLYTYPENRLIRWNKQHETLLGYTAEEIKGKLSTDLHLPEYKDAVLKAIDEVMEKGQSSVESSLLAKDGRLIPFFFTGVRFEARGRLYFMGTGIDITERKRAEEQLKHFNEELEKGIADRTEKLNASLDEKVVMLKEIHHRVKNNLQIILSLISLQSRNIKDQKLRDTMGEFRNRIMAMAHVHERMYRAGDFSRIDLSEIVTFLGTSLFASYNVNPQHIRLNVEIKDLLVTLDTAIPLSLIFNELISNSIKHAFVQGTTGEITIAGRREADTLVLSFRDTGIGIPKELDWMRNDQTLGHKLVVGLVQQLSGTIELDRTAGTTFNIVVKEKE